jgi:hypothetical protein
MMLYKLKVYINCVFSVGKSWGRSGRDRCQILSVMTVKYLKPNIGNASYEIRIRSSRKKVRYVINNCSVVMFFLVGYVLQRKLACTEY